MYISITVCLDAVLIGQQSHREIRGTEYFKVGQTTVSVCLPPSSRDNRVCEDDTIGTIRLINSSTIRMVEPHVATVTMTDDECEGKRGKNTVCVLSAISYHKFCIFGAVITSVSPYALSIHIKTNKT